MDVVASPVRDPPSRLERSESPIAHGRRLFFKPFCLKTCMRTLVPFFVRAGEDAGPPSPPFPLKPNKIGGNPPPARLHHCCPLHADDEATTPVRLESWMRMIDLQPLKRENTRL